jgi:flavin-dependent dehydrogenase
MPPANTRNYDLTIIGGGVAGLTAALQLKELRPKTRIAVLEKRKHPVPPTAYKVGESIAEVGAHYMKDVMGLESYLEETHLRKMGLRWFCSNNGNDDISRRIEYGLIRYSPLANFHLDRGAIENHLVDLCDDRGIEFRDETRVVDVDLGPDRHTVTIDRHGQGSELTTRWVMDATGREAFMRRRLGVNIDLPIDANSSWFRTPTNLVIDEWCDDPAWRAQVPSGTRWKSTVSFVGQGYWIWIINLGSGATSVGVVADPRFVSWDRIRRYDALLDWLRETEPQLAEHLPQEEGELLDFMKRKRFAHSCTRAFSRHRWALTGEAAVFLDPLYSTGHDLGAIANTLATDLMARELDGESGSEFSQRVRSHNRSLLGIVQLGLDVFPGQLAVYGDPQATGGKFLWDNASYFSILLNLFRNMAILDPAFVRSLQPVLRVNSEMNSFMQAQFRQWGTGDWDLRDAGVPVGADHLIANLFSTPLRELSKPDLKEHIENSVSRLHTISREMTTRMCEAAGQPAPDAPYDEPPLSDEPVLMWSDFEKRTRPPAEQEPQPEDGWLLR